jgi:hypothetical protein
MGRFSYEWTVAAIEPGDESPGYARNEKPAEAGSEVRVAG